MKKYVYILTDCNRKCLHVGYTDNLVEAVSFYKEMCAMFFDSNNHISRLVYFEEYSSDKLAMDRFDQLRIFTRPQKERLIRALNTNWEDLSLPRKTEVVLYDKIERNNRKISFLEQRKRHNPLHANHAS